MKKENRRWHFGVQARALLVDECVDCAKLIHELEVLLLRRISLKADNPPKPWCLRSEAGFSAQGRRRVFVGSTTGFARGAP